jgi:hypothetical protein
MSHRATSQCSLLNAADSGVLPYTPNVYQNVPRDDQRQNRRRQMRQTATTAHTLFSSDLASRPSDTSHLATSRRPFEHASSRAESPCCTTSTSYTSEPLISTTTGALMHAGPVITAPATDTPRSALLSHSIPPTTPATVRSPSVLSYTQAEVQCSPPAHKHHTRVCISVTHSHTAALYIPCPSPSLHSTPPTTPAIVRAPSVLPYTHKEAQSRHTAHKHHRCVCISITHSHTLALYIHCSSLSLHSTPPTTLATVRAPSVLPYTHKEAQCRQTAHKHRTRVCISIRHNHTAAWYIHRSSLSLHSTPLTTPATVRDPSVLPYTHKEAQCRQTAHKHRTHIFISVPHDQTAALYVPCSSSSRHSTPPMTPATVRPPSALSHTHAEAQCSPTAHNTTPASASVPHIATRRHCTHLVTLRHCIRPRRRHQPLCDLQVPSPTRKQKRSLAKLHANTTYASASALHTVTQQHCTHMVPLHRCIRPRRRHQPLCDFQVSSLTRTQKRSVALLHTSNTHASASASHTATQRHCTHIVTLRRWIRPRR